MEPAHDLASDAHRATIRAGKATVAGVFLTIIGLLVALGTYVLTAKSQREALETQTEASAVTLLQNYYALGLEHPDLTFPVEGDSASESPPLTDEAEWFAASALFTAESIYLSRRASESWRATVAHLIWTHRAYLVNADQALCEQYDPLFRAFIREAGELPDFCLECAGCRP